jgi:uncharacterized protein HemY
MDGVLFGDVAVVLFSGTAFGLATALMGVLIDKSKHHIEVSLGALVHFAGAALIVLAFLLSPDWTQCHLA